MELELEPKLELFNFIDNTISYMESKREEVAVTGVKLERFFFGAFDGMDCFLNVTHRIKSYGSLREKILRNNLFLKYQTPERLFQNLSDLIGIRIECRFIEDERKIYSELLRIFKINCGDGFYTDSLNSNIKLLLGEKQPQVQKNGFEIYKIDGIHNSCGEDVNFELQIKSLVNEFWGEIDHRVLYKNFNYMLTEDFFHDIMVSIKDNLSMIDRQLMIVYDHLNGMDTTNSNSKLSQVQAMISKIIHDLYISKIKDEIGFVLDFKKSTDLIVAYLLMKNQKAGADSLGDNFVKILDRINEISKNEIRLTTYLEFEREMYYNDRFTRRIGEAILRVLNDDFRWNLFFRIILEMEEGSNAEDFEGFLVFVRYQFMSVLEYATRGEDRPVELIRKMRTDFLDAVADRFEEHTEIEYITDLSLEPMKRYLQSALLGVVTEEAWTQVSEEVLGRVRRFGFSY